MVFALLALLALLAMVASASAQPIRLVTTSRPQSSLLRTVEAALAIQSNQQLQPAWGTPTISFMPPGHTEVGPGMVASGTWGLYLVQPNHWQRWLRDYAELPSHTLGFHSVIQPVMSDPVQPYAAVLWDPQHLRRSEIALSHQVLEMLTDRGQHVVTATGGAVEIADPVARLSYTVAGVSVSDFALRSWYTTQSVGPWDQMGRTSGPGDLRWGQTPIAGAAAAS